MANKSEYLIETNNLHRCKQTVVNKAENKDNSKINRNQGQ